LADRSVHSMIGYWHDSVVCLSVILRVVAKQYLVHTTAKVSKHVNKKCLPN